MPDHPEHQHFSVGDEPMVLLQQEDGTFLLLEEQEGDGLSRLRQEGEPYQFIILEDGSGDLLLELQPHTAVTVS